MGETTRKEKWWVVAHRSSDGKYQKTALMSRDRAYLLRFVKREKLAGCRVISETVEFSEGSDQCQ